MALPFVVGFIVGLAVVLCAFGIWCKAEGFEVCAKTRAEQEKEYAQIKKSNNPQIIAKAKDAEETGI